MTLKLAAGNTDVRELVPVLSQAYSTNCLMIMGDFPTLGRAIAATTS